MRFFSFVRLLTEEVAEMIFFFFAGPTKGKYFLTAGTRISVFEDLQEDRRVLKASSCLEMTFFVHFSRF